MSDERPGEEPQLEDEGIPDHEGPLTSKVRTGDQQDGMIPPGDRPRGANDFGTTAAEQLRGESLTERLEEEDEEALGAPGPVAERDDPLELGGLQSPGDVGQMTERGDTETDDEAELVASEFEDFAGESAEEAAVRAVREGEVPGAYDAPDDDYVDEESA